MKPACLLALCLLLPAFGDPPVVPDPSLHDLWFKVGIKVKGKTVSHDGSEVGKASFASTNYLHFVLEDPVADGEAPSTSYIIESWFEQTPGMWQSVELDPMAVVVTSHDDYVLPNIALFTEHEDAAGVVESTLLIHVKRDKQGDVTSAKLSTLGSQVPGAGVPGSFLYGSAKLTGKTVDVADLPFAP
jgi:hypothetical protein